MRHSLPILVVLLATVAACGQAVDESSTSTEVGSRDAVSNEMGSADSAVTESGAPPSRPTRQAGPDIRPETAPGVAFSYRYAFRLPADRVAPAQQAHQQLCERYGVDRCRITGINYRAASEDDVEAMLSLRVDRAIAGRFGRESVQAVIDADGALTDSHIEGSDVGSQIDSASRTLAELTARLEQIEARLRTARDSDKGQLEYEAEALRQQIRDMRGRREGHQTALATTPILLRYGSGSLAPGPAPAPSLGEALSETGEDFLYSLTLLLVVLVRLLPWAVAALLIWGVVSFVRRRFVPKTVPAAAEPGA